MNESRTIEEQYTSAGNADDLTVKADQRGEADADRSRLDAWHAGGALMRLHSEGTAQPRSGEWTKPKRSCFSVSSKPCAAQLTELQRGRAQGPLGAAHAGQCRADSLVLRHLPAVLRRGHELIHGTPSLGRACRKCGGSGKRHSPGGELGKAALNMMDECVHVARQSMRLRLRNML